MTEQEKIDIFNKIDFGDIDANADPNLEAYFIDDNYWQKIVESPVFYVIGKKGTGKSALYRMFKKYAMDRGALISNNDFGDFPINRIADLSDDDFAKPNQYQSIWQLVILNIFTSLIVRSETADRRNQHYKELQHYYNLRLGNASDLLRKSISTVRKKEHSLEVVNAGITPKIATESEISSDYSLDSSAISDLNRRLLDIITEYFKTCNDTAYLIQFDRLDDTYNQDIDLNTYYHIVISLMKVVYKINCNFRTSGIDNVKVLVYLRTDIIDEIGKRDSESARWERYSYKLNWAIVNRNDWNNPMLLKMINKRISVSIGREISLKQLLEDRTIQIRRERSANGRNIDVFKYIVDQTMHRPRDLIMFCQYIQNEIRESSCTKIDYRTIKNAEKEFCYWLVNKELANEINPILPNVDEIYNLLRAIGSRAFSFADFNSRYRGAGEWTQSIKADRLIERLYDVGILLNVNIRYDRSTGRHITERRTKIRNPGPVNRTMKLQIHPGVWKGIMQ